MNYILGTQENPNPCIPLAKLNDFTETEFYVYFGTIESIEKKFSKCL
jgi:hypothetical protein